MDRQLAYSGAIPLETDLLSTNKDAYIGLAKLAAAILGTNTLINGFTCSPTAPASLQISIGPGEIYILDQIDSTAYGVLPIDTHQIVKQGIALDASLISITPPGTVGYSQNYLIQFGFNQVDGDDVVLAYYNPFDPPNPYSGPNDTGDANSTVRQNNVVLSAKAGIAAPTGTQVTPTPDSGFVGGFVVTVANGQTNITAGNISTYASAPFITETLTQKISQTSADARYAQQTQVQNNALIYGVDSSVVANTVTANLSPIVTSYTAGMTVYIKINTTNTGASTLALNGLTAKSIVMQGGGALTGKELIAGAIAELYYDGTNFQIVNPSRGNLKNIQAFTSSGTYTPTAGARSAIVVVVGGGAGGSGSGGSGTTGGVGGTSSFGGLFTATGGQVGAGTTGGGGGGVGSGGILNLQGGSGDATTNLANTNSGRGGNTIFGGGGGSVQSNVPGTPGAAKTGGGGAGGGTVGAFNGSGGGGAGGASIGFIPLLASSYAITVGAGGTAGIGGSAPQFGGAGGSGVVIVYEFT